MHQRNDFDAARYEEIKAKCLVLAKTVVATPAPRCKPLPDLGILQSLLVTGFETGVLTARVQRQLIQPGDVLGTNSNGYLQIYIDNKPYRMYRLIRELCYGKDPNGHVDHRDGNRSNDATRNLRAVTPLQIARNRCKASANSSDRFLLTWFAEKGSRFCDDPWRGMDAAHVQKWKTLRPGP